MEEQNKQPEQEQETQEAAGEQTTQGTPTRSSIIMLLAGLYLLYTGYKLCKDVLDGVNGSGWGFFAAGVGFLIVGVIMLVISGRDLMKKDKAKRAAEAAVKEEIQKQPEPVEQKKSMSIAQRAHLADGLHEEVEEQTDTQENSVSLEKESEDEKSE